MKAPRFAGTAEKAVLTIAAAVLVSLLLWFIFLPERDYNYVPNQVERVVSSEYISQAGISQTFVSKGWLKGICVRWNTGRRVPTDDVTATLVIPGQETALEEVTVPAEKIRNNTETDIVFGRVYEPGEYRVVLTMAPDSADKIAVAESATDIYKEGEAFNSEGAKEKRDWYFYVLTAFPSSMMNRHRIQRILYAILTLLAGIAVTGWIWQQEQLMRNKRIASAIRFTGRHSDRILLAILILIPTLVYLDFLTGERLYVFNMLDRGADSVAQVYPGLLSTADRIRNGLWGEVFNFRQGLGDSEAALFPTLGNWVSFFGEDAVARLMGVSQWLKVVLSGVFAFLFVKEYGAGAVARFVVALGYAFNSMLIARGAWQSYPNIAMLAILWLYTYERKLHGKGMLPTAFATLFMFINLGMYDCVFYAVLLPSYMLIRRLTGKREGEKTLPLFMRDLGLFAVFALLGMLDTIRYLLIRTLASSRLQEGIEEFDQLGGFFSASEIWISAFLRTIGHSISGISTQTGSLNLLEGPAFYTGITAMLAAPASLWCMKGKQKRIYLLLVLAALLYIAVIPLRYVANGFARETFKLSSFWITVLLMLLSADFFSRAEKKDLRGGTKTVLGITALIIFGLLILAKATGYVADAGDWWISLILVALYLVLAELMVTGRQASAVRILAVLCVTAEAVLVPYGMIHNRSMETADENSRKEHAVTSEIIRSLPDGEWYRIEKDYVTVFQSDSLAEGYKGSASYVGGTEINSSVLDIYQHYSLPRRENHFLYGGGGNIRFESAASVRYLLTKDDMAFRYGYELIGEQNGIRVYENRYVFPFVYVSQDPATSGENAEEPAAYSEAEYRMENDTYFFEPLPENSVLIMEAEFDYNSRSGIYMRDRKGQTAGAYFMGGPNAVFEITNDDISSVWFDTGTKRHLKAISFHVADRENWYRNYREQAGEAQEHGVQIRIQEENRFTGTFSTEGPGWLITSIPYDRKWTVCLDGTPLETTRVNGGFLKARIPDAGEYRLEIRYAGDGWIKGNLFKLLGFAVFGATAVMVLCRKRKSGRKERTAGFYSPY